MEAERERVGVPESSASQRGLGESDVGKRDEWGMGKKARGEDQVGLQAEERGQLGRRQLRRALHGLKRKQTDDSSSLLTRTKVEPLRVPISRRPEP